jgi:DNA-directed RNA polymerase specialized sigma24 family protein
MPEPQAVGVTADAEHLRSAIARDYRRLCGYVATLVRRFEGPMRHDMVCERVDEVVAEAVGRALERSDAYDPRRSAFHWVTGIAINVMREARRRAGRPDQVRQADLGEAAWRRVLESLIDPATDQDGTETERLRWALAGLRQSDRQLLELGYVRGLDGTALAREVGAPSPGAARVRLCRAVKALAEAYRREAGQDRADGGGSQAMSHRDASLRRELAALAYLDAFERGDLDALAAAWEQAAGDRELEQVLCELIEGLADEQEPSPGWHGDAEKVRALLHPACLPPSRRSRWPGR